MLTLIKNAHFMFKGELLKPNCEYQTRRNDVNLMTSNETEWKAVFKSNRL